MTFLLQDKEEQVEDNESRCQNYRPAGRAAKHRKLGARTSEGRRMADLRNTYSVEGQIKNRYQKPLAFSNLSEFGLLHGIQKTRIRNCK